MKKDFTWKKIKSETKVVWAGETKSFPYNATQPPTVNSVAYTYKNIDEWMAVAERWTYLWTEYKSHSTDS